LAIADLMVKIGSRVLLREI